ncbi:MAG: hypothetical protein ACK5X3_02225, partial [Pseudomonadota bacterium]
HQYHVGVLIMKRIEKNVITGEVTVVDLTPEEIAAMPQPAAPPMPTITARQLRLALLGLGLTGAQVEAAINAMPGTDMQREAARIEWEYATSYQRDHQLVAMLGAALGLTEAQIDAAWMEAATI